MQWLFLAGAVLSEVAATLCLRVAAAGRRGFYAAVVVGYVLAFVFLTLALRVGIGLGVAYGIWAAAGVALTAIASHVLFKEPLTRTMILGILLIMAGVLVIEIGSSSH
ncbi:MULTISPECIES: DMT family transporter [Actinomycetes]|uniref:DMT family transporter n=1 Tax=Actinomycetes TaxID=1760 RepID=UPI0005B9D436|nr:MULTISPECIES: SMR family transporter [Actinomycetes]KWW33315.1 Multidrug resistance protein EbrB [Micrococcus luteus]MBS9538303.1 QacE family quaternary ammonium compound efflux SMR transporter [Micrococcus luteus]MCC0767374.1 QacE family quaternary ammonium compound efflux SMR transporter [Micrococcus luteus]MCK6110480.1 QacE family quaternary ammonium compound efflux SMR transporter [Micrococcus luteus]MCV7742308.1 SMR family transporter [Micrococcus luteus]